MTNTLAIIIGFLILFQPMQIHAKTSSNTIMSYAIQEYQEIHIYPSSVLKLLYSQSVMVCSIACNKEEQMCLSFYYTHERFEVNHTELDTDQLFSPSGFTSDLTVPMIEKMSSPVESETISKEELGLEGLWGDSNCLLLTTRLHTSQITLGIGTLGTMKDIQMLEGELPVFYQAQKLYITKTDAGIVAIYNCTVGNPQMTSFGWLYDSENQLWPRVSHEKSRYCMSNICNFKAISGSVLKLDYEDQNKLRLSVFCAQGEKRYSDSVSCLEGSLWKLEPDHSGENPLEVACVSPTCYKVNDDNIAHYSGTTSQTEKGAECVQWETPEGALSESAAYEYDGNNVSQMQNYCRDMTYRGKPYCYVFDYAFDTYVMEGCGLRICILNPYYIVPTPTP